MFEILAWSKSFVARVLFEMSTGNRACFGTSENGEKPERRKCKSCKIIFFGFDKFFMWK